MGMIENCIVLKCDYCPKEEIFIGLTKEEIILDSEERMIEWIKDGTNWYCSEECQRYCEEISSEGGGG